MVERLPASRLTTRTGRTKTTIFCITAAVLIATIGITAISSATPVQAKPAISNYHYHSSCSEGQGGCTGTDNGQQEYDGYHSNYNCNSKRYENTGYENYCKPS